jgi:hypothetical protein
VGWRCLRRTRSGGRRGSTVRLGRRTRRRRRRFSRRGAPHGKGCWRRRGGTW